MPMALYHRKPDKRQTSYTEIILDPSKFFKWLIHNNNIFFLVLSITPLRQNKLFESNTELWEILMGIFHLAFYKQN